MQVHVHLAGKNHRPYSIDQLRQYVQSGNFRDDHLAYYDGTNWMRIKDVPELVVQGKNPKTANKEALPCFQRYFHWAGGIVLLNQTAVIYDCTDNLSEFCHQFGNPSWNLFKVSFFLCFLQRSAKSSHFCRSSFFWLSVIFLSFQKSNICSLKFKSSLLWYRDS